MPAATCSCQIAPTPLRASILRAMPSEIVCSRIARQTYPANVKIVLSAQRKGRVSSGPATRPTSLRCNRARRTRVPYDERRLMRWFAHPNNEESAPGDPGRSLVASPGPQGVACGRLRLRPCGYCPQAQVNRRAECRQAPLIAYVYSVPFFGRYRPSNHTDWGNTIGFARLDCRRTVNLGIR
jgi:hypothetical protein